VNLADRERAFMRAELMRNAGITLDDGPVKITPTVAMTVTPMTDDERDSIREVLMAAGAPDRDMEWLTKSCPTLADALTYVAPALVRPVPNTFDLFTALED
jgi:hypothetical protein